MLSSSWKGKSDTFLSVGIYYNISFEVDETHFFFVNKKNHTWSCADPFKYSGFSWCTLFLINRENWRYMIDMRHSKKIEIEFIPTKQSINSFSWKPSKKSSCHLSWVCSHTVNSVVACLWMILVAHLAGFRKYYWNYCFLHMWHFPVL